MRDARKTTSGNSTSATPRFAKAGGAALVGSQDAKVRSVRSAASGVGSSPKPGLVRGGAGKTTPAEPRTDFSRLRAAFEILSDIYAVGGQAVRAEDGVRLSGIPRDRWGDLSGRAKREMVLVSELIEGPGQRVSVARRREVVIAAVGAGAMGARRLDVALLEVQGRGRIMKSLSVSSLDPSWTSKISGFTDWSCIDGAIASAEGNNQRAAIGYALLKAGVGRGKLEMLEVENTEEIDESTHAVRGADWLKAGLPRFMSASGEALWTLMRVRSVHSRLMLQKKQGSYTAMAIAAARASGLGAVEIAQRFALPEVFCRSVTAIPDEAPSFESSHLAGLPFCGLVAGDAEASACARKVWKGCAIHARSLSWRMEASRKARARLAAGEGLVEISASLGVRLRDMVRLLSLSEVECRSELERFMAGLAGPDLLSA